MSKKHLSLLVVIFTLSVLSSEVFAFTLPDTGQTKCYQGVSPYAEISCSGTGQDGAYNINPMSYTDNGNGTITDNVTGLMWQKEDDNKLRTWAGAGTYCDSLTLGGQSDWRLPTVKELVTIIDYSSYYPSPINNTMYFPNTDSSNYWSSIPSAYLGDAFVVGSLGGITIAKDRESYVRCVRGEQSVPSFTNNENATVTDNQTGLMWQQSAFTVMPWAAAMFYCENLNLGGHSDWRLPNMKELESIVDETMSPSIYSVFNVPYEYQSSRGYSYIWSSTTNVTYPYYAAAVFCGYGYAVNLEKVVSTMVLCVRGLLCSFAISPISQTFISTSSTGTVTVTASDSSCLWTATSSVSWITITSGSSGTGNGTVYFSVSANTTGATRNSNITIAGQTFAVTQSGAAAVTQNNCAASVSSSLVVHIPILTYSGSNYWTDLQYNSANSTLTVASADKVNDESSYSTCSASTLSSDYKLHIPVVMLNGVSYWVDLQWNGSALTITGSGQN